MGSSGMSQNISVEAFHNGDHPLAGRAVGACSQV
jgi:hypothetical protein